MAKRGRPTKFRDEYCDRLIEHMKAGYSFESFGPTIGVASSTTFAWLEDDKEGNPKHANFQEAKKRAEDESRLYWEEVGLKGLWYDARRPFNTTLWIFVMKNRFGWRDKPRDSSEEHNFNFNLSYDPNK